MRERKMLNQIFERAKSTLANKTLMHLSFVNLVEELHSNILHPGAFMAQTNMNIINGALHKCVHIVQGLM